MKQNVVKQRIRNGEPTIGIWLSLASVIAAERMAVAGFDWLTIDLEHAPTNWETALAMVAVVGGHGVAPLIRIPSATDENIKRALDLGAMGIIAPMIQSPEQARSVVASCKYPPAGIRSLAGGRNDAAWDTDASTYFARASDSIFVCIQIESVPAVERVDDILAVPGIDCAFIGPQDLCGALGLPPMLDNPDPRFEEAVQKVLASAKKHNVGCGLMVGSAATARQRHDQGFSMIALGAEVRLLSMAATQAVKEIKAGR
ncbi:MAG: 2-dehydro-3-deoxyglucarate aldolase [Chloroflexi bacterium]|nr:2-dehydro-3-deoxyglucarate aldolase [Chloroflexota bacterium]